MDVTQSSYQKIMVGDGMVVGYDNNLLITQTLFTQNSLIQVGNTNLID